jgi:hypothetical protein
VDLGSGLLGFVVADAAAADVVLGDCDMVGWLVDGVRVVCVVVRYRVLRWVWVL